MAQTFALITPVQPVLHRVSCSNETLPNAPNTTRRTKTWVWGPMGWITCFRWEKSRRDFVARAFALIALIHPVLHRVSCVYEMIPNAPKHYATHQNMSLGSNGLGVFGAKNPDVTSWHKLLHQFGPFWTECCNATNCPKCIQILRNTPKHEFRVHWSGLVVFVAKNPNVTSWHKLFH